MTKAHLSIWHIVLSRQEWGRDLAQMMPDHLSHGTRWNLSIIGEVHVSML